LCVFSLNSDFQLATTQQLVKYCQDLTVSTSLNWYTEVEGAYVSQIALGQ